MFDALRHIADRALTLDYDEFMFDIWLADRVQEIIVELNTRAESIDAKGQLYDLGIDSEGLGLGMYTPFSVDLREAKGLPADFITLFDEGIFYASFRVNPVTGGFDIIADPIRGDTNLFKDYGENIVGLTQNSKNILGRLILGSIQNGIKQRLSHI